jgi:HemK-like putative methylase
VAGTEGIVPEPPMVRPLYQPLFGKDEQESLVRVLYSEHYAPADSGSSKAKAGYYAAKTELQWLFDWAVEEFPRDTTKQRGAVKRAVLERIDLHKPLSYIIGWQPFLDCTIQCEPPVLIPRPETEQWTLWLRKLIAQDPDPEPIHVLDLCCGSGCVGTALAKADPRVHLTAVDISPAAVKLTAANLQRNGVISERWSVLKGDMFGAVPADRKFDLIVSNPPYIAEASYKSLPETVSRWEDRLALVGDKRHGGDAMAYYREICAEAPKFLKRPRQTVPSIVLELGEQAASVGEAFDAAAHDWTDVELHADWRRVPRWLAAAANRT